MKKNLINENKKYDFNKYQSPKWGFYLTSEILNGRLAMIALPVIVMIELFSKKPLINLIQLLF